MSAFGTLMKFEFKKTKQSLNISIPKQFL